MAHRWEHYEDPAKTPAQRFMGEPQRICRLCGVVQHLETSHSWMRVVGRRWVPAAPRCAVGTLGAAQVAALQALQAQTLPGEGSTPAPAVLRRLRDLQLVYEERGRWFISMRGRWALRVRDEGIVPDKKPCSSA